MYKNVFFLKLFLILISVDLNAAIKPGFQVPGKYEQEFNVKCEKLNVSCRYARIDIISHYEFIELNTFNVYVPNIKSFTNSTLQIAGNPILFWYSCGEKVIKYIELDIDEVDEEESNKYLFSHTISEKNGDQTVCYIGVRNGLADFLVKKNKKSYKLRVISSNNADSVNSKITRIYKSFDNGLSSFVITSRKGVRYYSDSSVFKGKNGENIYSRGEIVEGGQIIEFSFEKDAYVAISTYSSWRDVAKEYQDSVNENTSTEITAKLVAQLNWRNNVSDEQKLKRSMDYISNKIKYKAFDLNSGIRITRSFDNILASGVADCKEISLLLSSLLIAQGIDASSVITSTIKPMPLSIALPDFSWANHSVVRVPSLNMYIDMTQSVGRQVVQNGSPILNHLGIDAYTGNFVVIQ